MQGDREGPEQTSTGASHHQLCGHECNCEHHPLHGRAASDGTCHRGSGGDGRRQRPCAEPWNPVARTGGSDGSGGPPRESMGIPIVLDPVEAGATQLRTRSAHRLLNELSVAIVRGNVAEITALAGLDARIRGVESIDSTGDAAAVASEFAKQFGCAAAVTGPVDVVTDGMRLMRVANGHPMMATVTGTGCMATSVVAACADVERDSITATTAALVAYGLAGQIAAQRAQGPGTFQIYLYDALAGLTDDVLRAGVRIEG